MKNFFQKQFPLSTIIIIFSIFQIGQYTCSQTLQMSADQVSYNNSVSKLNAINVQDAIDEGTGITKGIDERTSKNEGDIIGLLARVEQLEKKPSGSGGGVCYTNYGQNVCADGFNTVYEGVVAASGLGSDGYGGMYCLSDTSLPTTSGSMQFITWIGGGQSSSGLVTGKATTCVVCCK